MRRRWSRLAAWGAFLLLTAGGVLAAGCVPGSPPTSAESLSAPASAGSGVGSAPPADSPAARQVTLQPGKQEDLERLLAAKRGQVVFVDYWATWCHTCVEMFPHTVEISRRHRDEGLAVISVTLDDLEDTEKARAYLEQQGADFDNLISAYESDAATAEGFGLQFSVPHFRLYDRSGQLRYSWDGEPEDLDAKVAELLAEPLPEEDAAAQAG